MAGSVSLVDLPLPAIGERFRLERERDGQLGVVRIVDGRRVGSMGLESADDGMFVRSLCVEAEYRGYGAGSEAALLFNEACQAAGVKTVRTWAPPDRGLAVYFWIRMGYHPLGGEGPEGGIWFERKPADHAVETTR
jgi:GNAT superfamily N-acetyltransferase